MKKLSFSCTLHGYDTYHFFHIFVDRHIKSFSFLLFSIIYDTNTTGNSSRATTWCRLQGWRCFEAFVQFLLFSIIFDTNTTGNSSRTTTWCRLRGWCCFALSRCRRNRRSRRRSGDFGWGRSRLL